MECIIPASNNPATSSAGSSSSSSSSSSKPNKMIISKVEKKGSAVVKKKNRGKGVMKLSSDPQSVAARERRHRISDRFKILQSMVPGGTKMNTASMLEEAIHYVKFLKTQILLHQTMINDSLNINELSPIMLLPHHQDYFLDDQILFSLQENNTSSVSLDDSMQILPELPLEQCCFQGVQDTNFFHANMK